VNYFNYINAGNKMNKKDDKNLYDPYQGFIRGNMFKDLYDPYKLSTPYDIEPANEQAKMLTSIDALKFAMIDLNLYLDVYPNDREFIELFNKYRIQVKDMVKDYESKYGPLTLESDAMMSLPWAWARTPWPWER